MGPSGGWNFSNIACIDTQPSFETFHKENFFHLRGEKNCACTAVHYPTLAQLSATLNKSVKSKVKVLRPHFLVFTQVSSFWKLFISFPLSVAKFATETMQAFSGSEYLPDTSRKCPTFEKIFLWKVHLLLGQRNWWWRVKNCVTSRSHWFLLRSFLADMPVPEHGIIWNNLAKLKIFSCPEQLNRWPCHSLTHCTIG